jgi:hypothetical protein
MDERESLVELLKSKLPLRVRINSVDFPYRDSAGMMNLCVGEEFDAKAFWVADHKLYSGIAVKFYDPTQERSWWVPIELTSLHGITLDKRLVVRKKLRRTW